MKVLTVDAGSSSLKCAVFAVDDGHERALFRENVDAVDDAVLADLRAVGAALGDVDRLVFTGGIGEHCPQIRGEILAGLGYLGDVEVLVIPTDENAMVALHASRLLL